MSAWSERILSEFPPDLSRLWIAADPDDVLLDEEILAELQSRGFEVLPFDDSIGFRTDYEERYRTPWDRGESGARPALVLHRRSAECADLPWDYLRQARIAALSLANLFPRLSYAVVRRIDATHRATLFDAQARHASQTLGEVATKDFILLHVFRLAPHLIERSEDLWRELLRLHRRHVTLPEVLAEHVESILSTNPVFTGLPVRALFSSSGLLLRTVQDAWTSELQGLGIQGSRIAETMTRGPAVRIEIPFAHPEIRVLVESMFLDGSLHPLLVGHVPSDLPVWAAVGILKDPAALQRLVAEGLQALLDGLPTMAATHRDWGAFAKRLGEILVRFRRLGAGYAEPLRDLLERVQREADASLLSWLDAHYWNLPSLPVAGAPVMVHHVPRFLALRRSAGETKLALLVFDGLAIDDWIEIRERLAERAPRLAFDEGACFAWLPTLTSVSRQALFAGMQPRELADSIETTGREPQLWERFWKDEGLPASAVIYRKSIRENAQLDALLEALADSAVKVAGIVVDTVDKMAHGAFLGKASVAGQIRDWCDTGFADRLFTGLLDAGFQVYVTADHGNVAAVGIGRPQEGVIVDMAGERVRVYRTEALRTASAQAFPGTASLATPALPPDFLPLFAGGRTAFVPKDERLVAHGGLAVEELIVPFVKVSRTR
ncbi:MAG: BREX-3 system phosphatase PglZ [Thiocapsa sp.]|uniref:BREX-3 system phosphatase PglZ n=1 Tax=Thiocapsa sp. TaxID=2024551 RepID=UPI001BCEB012|nr:BREX-3 system phosphatase PglZ [Thiocapsa sp.]QVL49515.1 MAG: BREX-3 system phosphatase PglZ [Thiocapsa sp.]